MGLNNFAISEALVKENGRFEFATKRVWAEVKKNYEALLDLAQKIANITIEKKCPPSSDDCRFCKDFQAHKEFG